MDTPVIARHAGRRLLVVEDDAQVNSMLTELATDYGYTVRSVRDGDDALRCLDREHFSVVILDLAMPRLSGGDVLALLRYVTQPEDTFVIVTTGKQTSDAELIEAGADRLLRKPFNLTDLEDALREAESTLA